MKLKDVLIVAVVALVPFAVFAAGNQGQGNQLSAQEKFKNLDTNHDGYVSKEEAMSSKRLSQDWSKADTNKDGKLEESEFSAFEENMMQNRMQNQMQNRDQMENQNQMRNQDQIRNQNQMQK